jgi:hypothetical protein
MNQTADDSRDKSNYWCHFIYGTQTFRLVDNLDIVDFYQSFKNIARCKNEKQLASLLDESLKFFVDNTELLRFTLEYTLFNKNENYNRDKMILDMEKYHNENILISIIPLEAANNEGVLNPICIINKTKNS